MEVSSILEVFKGKIEDAVTMVEAMDPDDQNEAINCWNQVSERLQEIINEAVRNYNNEMSLQIDPDKIPDYIDTSHLVAMEIIERFRISGGDHPQASEPPSPTPLPPLPPVQLDVNDGCSVRSEVERCMEEEMVDAVIFQDDHTVLVTQTVPDSLQSPQETENTVHLLIATDRLPPEFVQNSRKTKSGADVECSVCTRTFKSRRALKNHSLTHTKPHPCPLCSASFTTKANLYTHQRRHSGERPFVCPRCPMAFTMKGNLKRHIRTHFGLKPWKCDQCGSHFTEKKSLRIHARRHTGEKPYQCDLCPKAFTQSGILKTHKAIHLGTRAFQCTRCDRSFRQKSQLRVHEQRHLGLRKYDCTSCTAKFLTKGDLTRHVRTHTGERPYSCEQCERAFNRLQSLKEHMNRHLGRRPYSCKHCSKDFNEMSACYKHMKSHNHVKTAAGQKPGFEDVSDVRGSTVDLGAMKLLANASTFQQPTRR